MFNEKSGYSQDTEANFRRHEMQLGAVVTTDSTRIVNKQDDEGDCTDGGVDMKYGVLETCFCEQEVEQEDG